MKRLTLLLFLLTLTSTLAVTASFVFAKAGEGHSIFQTKTLSNGLEIVVVPNHLTPIATVVYVAKNGSYTESADFAGLSHLYEHMFFKKNRVMANEEAFNEMNRELGMQNNASTAEEVVEYHFTMPAKNLDKGISFMSNAIMAPAFAPEDVDREREVVLGEFDRDEASPTFGLSRAIDSAMWGDMLVRKEPLGQRPVIQAATQAKMFAIEHKFYIPNNSALLVSGDVDPDQVYKLAEKYLGDWKRGSDPFPTYTPPPFPPMTTQLVIRPAPEVPTVVVNLEYRGPSIGKDNRSTYAADLFSTIVNSPTSKLYKHLVDAGLALSVSVNYYTQQNVGPITISMECNPDKAKEAIKSLWNEIGQWSSPNYFTDAELSNAKQQISIGRLYEQENPTSFIVRNVSFNWAVTGLGYYDTYVDNVQHTTKSGIEDYLKKYIIGQPYVMGIASDPHVLSTLNLTHDEVMQ